MIYLLESKHEVKDVFKEYVLRVQAHWNLRVSKIRCDNGKEYLNKSIQYWCKQKGIVLDNTTPHMPQLNGRAERLNRTLLDKVRALLFDSGFNKNMWGEALYTSVYILNRLSTDTLQCTPFEMWEKRKPDLKMLQIFGSTVYVKRLGTLKKLEERSKRLYMIGYAPNGYRLWNTEEERIIIARDVKFLGIRTEENKIKENRSITNKIKFLQLNEESDETQNFENEEDNWEDANEGDGDTEDIRTQDRQERRVQDYEDVDKNKDTRRKSSRNKKCPEYLQEYVMLTYKQAVSGPDKQRWEKAINEEKKSLEENQTWEIMDLKKLKGEKPLTGKWVFKIKQNGRYKARLVIRGCQQEQGVNYEETFSPVISTSALRSLFALAAIKNYKIMTFDIKTAFLYGNVEESIYMYPPEGYNCKDKVFKLKRALYGLKQAPLRWNIRFTDFLKEKNFKPLKSEQCIFRSINKDLILGIYVDDGIILGSDVREIEETIKQLRTEFKMMVFYKPKIFVGIEVLKEENKIKLKQEEYTNKILKQYEMDKAKSVKIPILKNDTRDTRKKEEYKYREVIGSLLYLSTKTRPDISFGVGYSSRFIEDYKQENVNDVKHILKYLIGTIDQGIQFNSKAKQNLLQAYCDADFAGDQETRRITTGYIIFYGGGALSWCSRRQPIIVLSSTEAEYVAAAECCKELLYLKTLLEELQEKKIEIELYIDNQSAISLISNGVVNKRSKHIDVKYRFIHELFKNKVISVKYCSTENQKADILTKALNTIKFENCKKYIVN